MSNPSLTNATSQRWKRGKANIQRNWLKLNKKKSFILNPKVRETHNHNYEPYCPNLKRYSEIMITAVLFILITATLAYYYFLRRNSNYPPGNFWWIIKYFIFILFSCLVLGPFPLPIIGNLHQIATNPHIVFQRMSKKYGPIVAFKFGPDKYRKLTLGSNLNLAILIPKNLFPVPLPFMEQS